MLFVSISIMYFFASVTKLDPLWLDGSTLKLELSTSDTMKDLCEWLGWGLSAKLTLAAELALVVLIQWRRGWLAAFAIGVGMHMSFHHSGLEIGLFSYYMVAIYLLLLPESVFSFVAKLARPGKNLLATLAKLDKHPQLPWVCFGLSLGASVGLLPLLPLDTVNTIVLSIVVYACLDLLLRRAGATRALVHLFAVFFLLLMVHKSDTIRDYYRYWGGQERRSGNISAATIAYEDLVRFEPSYVSGRRRLGDLYRMAKRYEEAAEQYEAGLVLDPNDFKLNLAAAQLYHLMGKGQQALERAERGLQSNPQDANLRRLRTHWKKQLGQQPQHDPNAPSR
jgi:hypothetical protein